MLYHTRLYNSGKCSPLLVRLGPCAQLYSLRHRTVQIFVFLEIFLLAQVLQLPTRTPDFNRIVVGDGDQHFRITRVERHGVDNIVMRVFDEACSIVAVPKVAILVLGSTKSKDEFNLILFKFIYDYVSNTWQHIRCKRQEI